ncbi:MAG: M67 family metallopeptidase [Chloroflexota bacterium]
MTTVTIPQSIYDAIIAHSREGKPEEICGILRGKGLQAFELIRGQNVAQDRINNYTIDPQTLLLQFKFEENDYPDGGTEMMGIYHSHPISVAYPSATDAWNAHYPESIYFICSLEFDDTPVICAFQMLSHFESDQLSIDLPALREALDFFEIRPDSHIYAYFHEQNTLTPAVLTPIAQQFEASFYLLYHLDGDEIVDFETRVVTIIEHEVFASI